MSRTRPAMQEKKKEQQTSSEFATITLFSLTEGRPPGQRPSLSFEGGRQAEVENDYNCNLDTCGFVNVRHGFAWRRIFEFPVNGLANVVCSYTIAVPSSTFPLFRSLWLKAVSVQALVGR